MTNHPNPPGHPNQPGFGSGPPSNWPPAQPPFGAQSGYPPPVHPPAGYVPGQGFSPWQPGMPGGAPPSKGRKPLLITVGAAVVVLVVIGALVTILKFSGDDAPTTAGGSAVDVAKSYLEALARGDAQAALDLGAAEPASTDLLTDEVLKEQQAKMPLTDIKILGEAKEPGAADDQTSVKVSAKFANQKSEASLDMTRTDEGWKLSSAFVNAATLPMPSKDAPENTLLFFGKPSDGSNHVYVFPGYLEAKSSSPYLDVNQLPPLLLDQVGGIMPSTVEVKFSMNDAGKKASEDAVRAWLTKCYSPGPAMAECDGTRNFTDSDLDPNSLALTAPLDLSGMTYDFIGATTSVYVKGDLKAVPITVRRNDGATVPMLFDLTFTREVELLKAPAVVVAPK